MSNKAFFAFVAGATVGVVATWTYAKNYFNQIIDDTVKKYTKAEEEEQPPIPKSEGKGNAPESESAEDDSEDEEDEQSPSTSYHKAVKDYTPDEDESGPYVITATEFRDGAMATCCTLSYFEDGIVTDADGNIVEDVKGILGEDFVDAFDDEDECYVRNEERNCDYEIIREGCDFYDESD